MITLSVLDQLPIFRGNTARETVCEAVALAQAVERLGYQRFWVAEHHGARSMACASPEILATVIAAQTSTIRVGTGGVLLPYYSALKVAETFRMLHTLFPNRIDLGVGRGLGSSAATAQALNPQLPKKEHFPRQLRDLLAFLDNTLSSETEREPVRAMPDGPGTPEVWLLGTGQESPEIAASLGVSFCFGQFLRKESFPHVLETYRRQFCPSPSLQQPRASLALRVICAEREEEAHRLARYYWGAYLYGMGIRKIPPPVNDETPFPPYSKQERQIIDDSELLLVTGNPMQVQTRLLELAEKYKIEELVIVNGCPDFATRLRSYELLAEMFTDPGRENESMKSSNG